MVLHGFDLIYLTHTLSYELLARLSFTRWVTNTLQYQ